MIIARKFNDKICDFEEMLVCFKEEGEVYCDWINFTPPPPPPPLRNVRKLPMLVLDAAPLENMRAVLSV